MLKKIIIVIFFFNNFFIYNLNAVENKILIKINNEIISTIDIYNEIKYLKFINPKLENLSQENIFEIARNSLIREKIKQIELLNNNLNLDVDKKILEKIKKNFLERFKINSNQEFQTFLSKENLNEKDIMQKIIIENLWNSLIVKKFIKDVKIDEESIKKEINEMEFQSEYNLSELVFELSDKENVNSKYEIILDKINNESFEDAVVLFSISETSKTGGSLGWIKESTLNKKIRDELIFFKSGEFSKPIVIPGGFLILKINDKRIVKREINIEKEIQAVIKNKTNKQLNQFSIMYFNKIKKNVLINEL